MLAYVSQCLSGGVSLDMSWYVATVLDLEDWHPALECAVSTGLKEQFDDGCAWTEILRGLMGGLPKPDR